MANQRVVGVPSDQENHEGQVSTGSQNGHTFLISEDAERNVSMEPARTVDIRTDQIPPPRQGSTRVRQEQNSAIGSSEVCTGSGTTNPRRTFYLDEEELQRTTLC